MKACSNLDLSGATVSALMRSTLLHFVELKKTHWLGRKRVGGSLRAKIKSGFPRMFDGVFVACFGVWLLAASALDRVGPSSVASKEIDPQIMAVRARVWWCACGGVWWRAMCGAESCGVVWCVACRSLGAALARPSSCVA